MNIAIITDTHFGARNDNINFSEYFYKFYDEQFFPYLKEHNIKHCIHLGDIMDRRKYVSYRTAKEFREKFIRPFIDLGIELHVLVGNHDTYFKNTNDVNSVVELIGDRYENIKKLVPPRITCKFSSTNPLNTSAYVPICFLTVLLSSSFSIFSICLVAISYNIYTCLLYTSDAADE